MIKLSAIITLALALFTFNSCGHNSNRVTKSKFFEFLNNYQADSLNSILTENFEIIRNFGRSKTDRKQFLEYYVPVSRNFKSKLKILESESSEENEKYQVEDQSEYLQLLKIHYPEWSITLNKNSKGQIERAIFDTTKGYQDYLVESKKKGDDFANWLHQKYPEEKIDNIYTTPGFMQTRLKEYLSSK